MPHTVYTFLQQVSLNLFNNGGYSFHHNAEHITQAGTAENHLTPPDFGNLGERFRKSGFGSVLFQEYSNALPHEKYTLGYTGRPGGPNFYINTKDNTELHGPNGYSVDGLADPCFAKVVKGQEVVDLIHQQSGELGAGDYKEFNDGNVAVRSIKLIKLAEHHAAELDIL